MSGPFFYKDCTHDCTSSQQRAADLRPAPAYRLHCRRRPQRPFRIRYRWPLTAMGCPLRRQSSIAGSGLREIAESDLRSGDLLFFSSLGVTWFGIRAFSPSSVSHVALYLVNNPKAGAE
ncbi:lipoprotein yaeF [Klebsiella quasipneumoniae]|nr:lipoprotein yaeF [Klebsiella quasipneumoniae]